MKPYHAALLCLCFVFSTCQTREENSFPDNVAATIEQRIEAGINPSIVVGIIDEHGMSYYNFGKRSADGPPADEHTIYEIGSISKTFTALLLAQQVLDGTVSVDDPINKYLPDEAQVPVKGSTPITLGHLSDHTSGFPRMPDNFTPANLNNPYADYTVQQMYAFISSSGPVRPVGEYEYSNLAQGLLGHILASNRGLDYDSLMTRDIAAPLGMEETRVVLSQQMRDHLAIGHNAGGEVENWDIPTLAGAGAIRSSTSDILKYLAANMGLAETPLRAAMDLTHVARHHKAGDNRVGLAWFIRKSDHGDIFWHSGGTGGYRAFAGFAKETGKGVVVLTNCSEGIQDIGFRLLDQKTELIKIRSRSEAIEVSAEILDRYVGKYELAPDFQLTITREGTQLYVQGTGQPKLELFAETKRKFFLTRVLGEIIFNVEDDKVESLTLLKEGAKIKARKVE